MATTHDTSYVIVAGIGFDDTTLAVARAALRAAERKAVAEVHFAHVLDIVPGRSDVDVDPSDAAAEIATARRRLDTLVDELAHAHAHAQAVPIRLSVLLGRPARKLTELAAAVGAGLIVVGTHGRRGLRGLVMGPVAEEVARDAPCQVLTVRPLPVSRWARRLQRRAVAALDK